MDNKTYSVVRFSDTTLPGSTRFFETEVDADGAELIGLTFNQAQDELQPAASRYLDDCVRELEEYGNGVGYPKEGHWIDYSIKCCFGIIDSDGWMVDPESGAPLKKMSTWSELNEDEE